MASEKGTAASLWNDSLVKSGHANKLSSPFVLNQMAILKIA